MPPLTPVQNNRKVNVNKYVALYNKYISPILGSKPITLKEKDIDKYVSDEKNYPGFEEAQGMNTVLDSRKRYAEQLQASREGFKARLLQNEMLPVLPGMDEKTILKNTQHNTELLQKYAEGVEGDKNELEKEQKYWKQLLRVDYNGLEFKPNEKPSDRLRKIDANNLLFNVDVISSRLKRLGQAPDAKEYKLLSQKSLFTRNYFQYETARMQLASNFLMHSIPGVDWAKMKDEQLIQIRMELTTQSAMNPENSELKDFLETFTEMADNLTAYKTLETMGPRQAQVLGYFYDNLMFTNHGFNAHCYDMDGNPIDNPTEAVDEYARSGKPFIVAYDMDFVKAEIEDKFSVFTLDKNGNVVTEKVDPAKYPNIYQKRLEQYQQKIVEQANEAHEAEMQQREAEIRKAAQEREKAEADRQKAEVEKLKAQQDAEKLKAQQAAEKLKAQQQNAESGLKDQQAQKEEAKKEDIKTQVQPQEIKQEEPKPQVQPEKKEEPKKEEPKKEEPKKEDPQPEIKPDEGQLLKEIPQYKDPFVVPEMKSEQLTKKLIKERYNAAVNINKELNSYYPKMNKFPFNKEEYTQLAADQNRYDTHKYAEQLTGFIDGITKPSLQSLQGLSVAVMSGLVPNELKDKSAKDIIKYFVSKAYNADPGWLMNVNNDMDLTKNMAKHYSDLKIISMGREIIESAQRENIKLDIPAEVKSTIIVNSELVNKKFNTAMSRINLLADPNYHLMPDCEAHNIESFMAESYAAEITQKNINDTKNKNHQLSSLVKTFDVYALALENKQAFQKEIDINRQLYNDDVLMDLDVDNAECFVLGSKPVKKNYAEVIKALSEGRSIAFFQNQRHLGTVISLDEDGKLEVEQRQRYAIIGDVEPTDPEKRYEAKHLENKKKQARIKRMRDERRASLEKLSDRISSKALNGVPQGQWPKDLNKDLYSGEARINVSKAKWDKIKNNIDDYISTEDEIAQQLDAKEQLVSLKEHKTLVMENEQQLDELPWMMYQLFKAPLPETHENKAENDKNAVYNGELFNALNFREEVYEKYNVLRENRNTVEEKNEFQNYHDELLANPVKYVKNPDRAKKEMGDLFQKVITECNPNWFEDLTDETMIKDWSKKAPYFELLTNDQFIKTVKNWGVKISTHDMDVFDTEKILLTEKIAALNRKMQSLTKPYYKEFDKLKLDKNERRLADMSSKMYDRYTEYELLSGFVESTRRGSEKADKLIEFLKSMDCYVADLNNLSNGKVFCNKNGVPLAVGDALERIRQDAGKPINKRVSDNVVFVMDHTAKTCKRVCLDENGDYSCTDGNYKEMLEATKLSESKSVAVDNTKLLKENQLGVKQTISALERYKKKFDNTDFWPFVKNRKQITDMRKQLDVVLKLYKDLKPVPLDSDIKKLNNALNDFNTKLGDYIRYKEAKEGMTPENGYPEGYFSNTMKAQKDLTWRAFDRLDTAYQLKSLTELSLLPNVKSDVIEFALYNQQQRIMNREQGDLVINPKKPDVLAAYNRTLANLRVQKNMRLRELAEASSNLSALIGYSLSQDFLEEGHVELQAYNNADDLLVDAYDFETVKGKPVYSKETQDKIYSDLAKCICNWTLHRYKDNDEYKAVENLDLSGFDSTEKMFDIDAKRLAESEEIKKLLPPEKLNPMAVINIVSDLPNLMGRFKEACGIDPASLLRRYQVERKAVTVGKVSVNLMPTDPKFDKQAMQDRIDGKVHDYGDIENFLNDEQPEIRPVEPVIHH